MCAQCVFLALFMNSINGKVAEAGKAAAGEALGPFRGARGNAGRARRREGARCAMSRWACRAVRRLRASALARGCTFSSAPRCPSAAPPDDTEGVPVDEEVERVGARSRPLAVSS